MSQEKTGHILHSSACFLTGFMCHLFGTISFFTLFRIIIRPYGGQTDREGMSGGTITTQLMQGMCVAEYRLCLHTMTLYIHP